MPNNRLPIDFAVHHGNLKISNEEIERRRAAEVTAKDDDIKPNDFLPEHLHDKFYWYANQLEEFDLMTNLDCDSLSRYVELQESYEEVTNRLKTLDILEDIGTYKLLEVIQNKRLKELRQLGNDLGMTMVGRAKLSKPVKEEKEPTPEEQMFGGMLR